MTVSEGPSCFAAKPPSFFKIVLASALRDGKIEIPRAFLMEHGHCLAESILLKVPCGVEWQTGLTRCNGEVWLEEGWPEFLRFYSLNHGFLLVFSSEGDYSSLQVRILSRNTIEIDYQLNLSHGEREELEDDDDDASVEILDVDSSKKRGGTELASLWPHKRSYEGASTSTASTSLEADEPNGDTRDRAFLRATSFIYSNPHVVIRMQKSYISRYLKILGAFAKECVCAGGARTVNLHWESLACYVHCRDT